MNVLQRPLLRFLTWVGFLILVAIVAVVAGLHGVSIAIVEGIAWVVVAAIEFWIARPRSERRVVVPSIPGLVPDPLAASGPTVRVLGRDDDDVSFEWMTEEIDAELPDYDLGEALPDLNTIVLPEPEIEESAPVEALAEEIEPELEPEPAYEAEPEPIAPLAAVPDLAPEPEPEPQPEPEPVAEVVPLWAGALTGGQPVQWNVWSLENAVKEHAHDYIEIGYMVVYLRDFAKPDGMLPIDFDSLVRESFGHVLALSRA